MKVRYKEGVSMSLPPTLKKKKTWVRIEPDLMVPGNFLKMEL